MTHPATPRTALAAAVLSSLTASLFGQAFTVTATTTQAIEVSAYEVGQPLAQESLPAGTNVANGFQLQTTSLTNASAFANFWMSAQAHSFGATLAASAATGWLALPGASAGVGRQEVLLQVTLTQPMTLRVSMAASLITCSGAPAGIATIDIGNDGIVDFSLTGAAATTTGFAQDDLSVIVSMPAGTTPVLLSTELNLPPLRNQLSRVAEVHTSFGITPGHADITREGGQCGALLDAVPLLDGESVRFWVTGQQIGDIPLLLLGTQRQTVALPITPGCDLLIVPDVTDVVPFWSYHVLPLGLLGPGELVVQGAILRPVTVGLAPAGLHMTDRIAIELR